MTRLFLSDDALHVWWSPSQSAPAAALAWLSPQERQRHARFHREPDRQAFAAAHAMLRILLKAYGSAHADAEFISGRHGKPATADDLYFNLSHTRGMVACAFSRIAELGVDVETPERRNDWQRMQEQVLSPDEITTLQSVPQALRQQQFYRLWTLKEAWSKALGTGLHSDFRELDVARPRPPLFLTRFDPTSPFLGAVACLQTPAQLLVRQFAWKLA